ncbi:hypothetical protein [Polyangium mundeleinium]|uniref:Uncharacterized protein n=1 Tax=Polyangium mundeleinium TaxID=2995306 RepID=A0ABT5F1Z0_9BACT|nr:hypothetical protein [Polyangium mundeleinium]MDC0748112.1 hypothetical protein [Polyangium mundeleinium]
MPPISQKIPPKPSPKDPTDPRDSGSGLAGAALAAFVIAIVIVGVRYWGSRGEPGAARPGVDAGDADAALVEDKPPPPRCAAISAEPFVVGEPQAAKAPKVPDAGQGLGTQDAGGDPKPQTSTHDEEEEFDELAPFAVELGRGTSFEGGFAVGALRDGEGGSVAMVATLGFDGRGGKLVRLGRSRGDFDAPTVSGYKGSVLAAMLEPNAGGRAIRLARVSGEQVTWGPELSEGRDESLAVDLAASGAGAVVVWDDVSKDGKQTMVMLAPFDPETMKGKGEPRPVSPPKQDAETPRLAARPGGLWLAYVVVGTARKPKDEDTGLVGEAIAPRWIEVVPLDEHGAAVALPRAVTPKDGHALAFDVEPSEDGGMVVTYRDDDTPSGSNGGRVMSVWVRLSGVGEAKLLTEEPTTAGVPDLMPGWLAVSSLSGATRIGAMTPRGELMGELRPEPVLGNGEVLAATRAALLVARPAGKAMKLSVMQCVPDDPGVADAGLEAGTPPP